MPEETEVAPLAEMAGPQPLFSEEEIINLRAIKLNNGHDILGVIVATDDEHIFVRRPCQIFRQANGDGTAHIMLLKWQPFSNSEVHVVNKTSFVTYCRVNPDIFEFYTKSVISQIEEENKAGDLSGIVWPEWMDNPTPIQIN